MSANELKEMLEEVKQILPRNPNRALGIVQAVLEKDPENYNALILEGIVLQVLGEKNAESQALAFESFKKAINLHPNQAQVTSVVWRQLIIHFSRQSGEENSNIESDLEYFLNSKAFVETLVQQLQSTDNDVRKIGIKAVCYLYKKYLFTESAFQFPSSLKEEVMKSYTRGFEDKVMLQKVITTSIIPCYHANADSKTKVTYTLEFYGSLSQDGKKAFEEIITTRIQLREHLVLFIDAAKNCTGKDDQRNLNRLMKIVISHIPEVGDSSKLLIDFAAEVRQNPSFLKLIHDVLGPNTSSREIKAGITKLHNVSKQKPYSKLICPLIYRAVEIIFDSEFIETLERYILKMIQRSSGHQFFEDIGLSKTEAIENGLNILNFLICSCNYARKMTNRSKTNLIKLLELELPEEYLHYVLESLAKTAKEDGKPIEDESGTIIAKCKKCLFRPIWLNAKQSIHALYYNLPDEERVETFKHILDNKIKRHLQKEDSPQCTKAIKVIGQILILFPTNFKEEMRVLVSDIIAKKLILQPQRSKEDILLDMKPWTEDTTSLPQSTQNMIAGFKTLVLWLINVGQNQVRAPKIFTMLTHFISTSGETKSENMIPFKEVEKSWIRLSAGRAFLRLCHSGYQIGEYYSLTQWYKLSGLMIDPEFGVRKMFSEKFTKYLTKGFPDACLAAPFMAYFALAGFETNPKFRIQMKKSYEENCSLRRKYMIELKEAMPNVEDKYLRALQPDYIVVSVIPLLTNSSKFTSPQSMPELRAVTEALWFILEPLVKHPDFNYNFYEKIHSSLRLCVERTQDTPEADKKMWVLCEIMMHLIVQRSKKLNTEIPCPKNPYISNTLIEKHPDPNFKNQIDYLPGVLLRPGAFKRKFPIGKSGSETELVFSSEPEEAEEVEIESEAESVPRARKIPTKTVYKKKVLEKTVSPPFDEESEDVEIESEAEFEPKARKIPKKETLPKNKVQKKAVSPPLPLDEKEEIESEAEAIPKARKAPKKTAYKKKVLKKTVSPSPRLDEAEAEDVEIESEAESLPKARKIPTETVYKKKVPKKPLFPTFDEESEDVEIESEAEFEPKARKIPKKETVPKNKVQTKAVSPPLDEKEEIESEFIPKGRKAPKKTAYKKKILKKTVSPRLDEAEAEDIEIVSEAESLPKARKIPREAVYKKKVPEKTVSPPFDEESEDVGIESEAEIELKARKMPKKETAPKIKVQKKTVPPPLDEKVAEYVESESEAESGLKSRKLQTKTVYKKKVLKKTLSPPFDAEAQDVESENETEFGAKSRKIPKKKSAPKIKLPKKA